MRIRRGGPGDADAVIALFDEAVAWMVARGQTGQLRVDCWAGAPKLVGFYEAQGFVRDGTFDVRGWPGQVFVMRLGHQPGTVAR